MSVRASSQVEYQTVTNRVDVIRETAGSLLYGKSAIINFEVQLDKDGVFVKRMLEGWRFLRAASKPGYIKIEHLDTGFAILQQRNESHEFELPLPFWFEMLEKLVFIQSKTRLPIIFPSRNISHEEIKRIFETASVLETGKITPESVTMTGVRELGKTILEHFASGNPFYLESSRDEDVEIFDVTIPLGTVVTTIHDGYLPEEDLAALKKAVDESSNEEDIVTICFKSYPDRPITVEYRKWLPSKNRRWLFLWRTLSIVAPPF